MELFVKIHFWLAIANVIMGLILLEVKTFPYTQEKTIGGAVVSILMSIALAVWAGLILW